MSKGLFRPMEIQERPSFTFCASNREKKDRARKGKRDKNKITLIMNPSYPSSKIVFAIKMRQ